MTVQAEESSKRFHGSGNPGPFTWSWRFLADEDISVYRIRKPNEAQPSLEVRELLTEGGDYTLTGAASYWGGSATLTFNLPGGEDLIVDRNTSPLQKTDFRSRGNFDAEVHEEAFDALTMMIQDRDRLIQEARALALSFSVIPVSAAVSLRVDLPVSAAAGDVTTDLAGLDEAFVIKTDNSANRVIIIDTSGATFEGQQGYRDGLQLQNEGAYLKKLNGDWKRLA